MRTSLPLSSSLETIADRERSVTQRWLVPSAALLTWVLVMSVAALLGGCSTLPASPTPTCSSAYQCEIEAYNRAGH